MNNDYNNSSRDRNRPVNNTFTPKVVPELDKKTYVKQAENVIGKLNTNKFNKIGITSSQIRNLLTLVNEVYNIIQHDNNEKLSDEVQSRAQYIKMRIAYNAGREPYVKDFVEKSNIMEYIDKSGDSREKLMIVCNYMEALVAYHRFVRGND